MIRAMIAEIDSLLELRQYLKPGEAPTLIALDIDQTIMRAPDLWGSEAWYDARIQELRAQGLDEVRATLQANDDWEAIQKTIVPVPMESKTISFLHELQSEPSVHLMGITARRPDIGELTRQHLENLGFTFENKCPLATPLTLTETSKYELGILFVGPLSPKGLELARFLPSLPVKPGHVIFVDDRPHQVASVDDHIRQFDLSVTALRYYGQK
jgi:hypothetical protein